MNKLISKLTLKSVVTATTLLTLFSLIVPDVAEARRFRGGGRSRDGFNEDNLSSLLFGIDSTANTIQDFELIYDLDRDNSTDDDKITLSFATGNLSSQDCCDFNLDRFTVPGDSDFSEAELIADFDQFSASFVGGTVSNPDNGTGLDEETFTGSFEFIFPKGVSLDDADTVPGVNSDGELIGFLQVDEPFATDFNSVADIDGNTPAFQTSDGAGGLIITTNNLTFSFTNVPDGETTPEPSGILSLLAIAAFGTKCLVKRKSH